MKNGAQPSNKDILLYSDKGKQIYMFAYDETTPASQAKRLRDEAENVSWGAIAWSREAKSFLSRKRCKSVWRLCENGSFEPFELRVELSLVLGGTIQGHRAE